MFINLLFRTFLQIFTHERLKAHSQFLDNFLASESSLKMMKNAFYFTLKSIFVLKIFKLVS